MWQQFFPWHPLALHVKAATWHVCQHSRVIAGKISMTHPHVGFGHVPKITHAPTNGNGRKPAPI